VRVPAYVEGWVRGEPMPCPAFIVAFLGAAKDAKETGMKKILKKRKTPVESYWWIFFQRYGRSISTGRAQTRYGLTYSGWSHRFAVLIVGVA
jgi:hypothetical protein